jgi:hypothetical protein
MLHHMQKELAAKEKELAAAQVPLQGYKYCLPLLTKAAALVHCGLFLGVRSISSEGGVFLGVLVRRRGACTFLQQSTQA